MDKLIVGAGAHRSLVAAVAAAHPVVAAQLALHRAADALRRDGLELHALRGVEARQRIRQADHADLDQVVELDVGRQLGDHPVGQATDRRTRDMRRWPRLAAGPRGKK